MEALNRRIEAVDFPVLIQIRQWATREPFPSIFEVLGIVAICQGEAKSNVLFLREELVMGIERNLDRKISELNVPIRKEGVTVNRLPDDFLPLFLALNC